MSGQNRAYIPPVRIYRAFLGDKIKVREGSGEYVMSFATTKMRDNWLKRVQQSPKSGPAFSKWTGD